MKNTRREGPRQVRIYDAVSSIFRGDGPRKKRMSNLLRFAQTASFGE